jgi:hypothetical protein
MDHPDLISLPEDRWRAYERFRPLLLHALAKLARSGFAVTPTEGMDLIHDFFLEAWDRVVENFRQHFDRARPSATAEGYVFGAFIQFARPCILRQRRWEERLVDAANLARFLASSPDADPATVPDLPFHEVELGTVIEGLSEKDWELVEGYFGREAKSERELSEELGITRYGVRERLIDLMARVTIALGQRGRILASDWPVAVELWKERRTTREAAGRLGLSPREVQRARVRIVECLAEGIGRRLRAHTR